MKALSVATDVREGIDLTALEAGAAKLSGESLLADDQRPESAWFYAQRREKSAVWWRCWRRYNVMLIEDDVYSELYFGREKPLPAKVLGSRTR